MVSFSVVQMPVVVQELTLLEQPDVVEFGQRSAPEIVTRRAVLQQLVSARSQDANVSSIVPLWMCGRIPDSKGM